MSWSICMHCIDTKNAVINLIESSTVRNAEDKLVNGISSGTIELKSVLQWKWTAMHSLLWHTFWVWVWTVVQSEPTFSLKQFRYWLSRRVSDKSHNVSRQMWPWPGRIGTIPRPTGLSGGGQVVWSCWGVIQQTHPTASDRDWGSEWPWSVGWPRLGEVVK